MGLEFIRFSKNPWTEVKTVVYYKEEQVGEKGATVSGANSRHSTLQTFYTGPISTQTHFMPISKLGRSRNVVESSYVQTPRTVKKIKTNQKSRALTKLSVVK